MVEEKIKSTWRVVLIKPTKMPKSEKRKRDN
jgi:hypothetical protein